MPRKAKIGNNTKVKAGFQTMRATGGGLIKAAQTPRKNPTPGLLWDALLLGQRARKERTK